jgi:hypothetical protein
MSAHYITAQCTDECSKEKDERLSNFDGGTCGSATHRAERGARAKTMRKPMAVARLSGE